MGKRITLHSVMLAPQLKMILSENISTLIKVHQSLHRVIQIFHSLLVSHEMVSHETREGELIADRKLH